MPADLLCIRKSKQQHFGPIAIAPLSTVVSPLSPNGAITFPVWQHHPCVVVSCATGPRRPLESEPEESVGYCYFRVPFVARFESDPHKPDCPLFLGFRGQADARETKNIQRIETAPVVPNAKSLRRAQISEGHVPGTVVHRVLKKLKRCKSF